MQKAYCHEALCCGSWNLAVVGKAIDARGKKATEFARNKAETVIQIYYQVNNSFLQVDGRRAECEDLQRKLEPYTDRAIVLETTTLGFAEVLLCCLALNSSRASHISMLYTEPALYNAPHRHEEVLARREFDLSEDVWGYRAIPGVIQELHEGKRQRIVFLLGYEGERFDRAFEELPIVPKNCYVVFGVPAFQPGWEMDSFSNNVQVMQERQIRHQLFFCGADNPLAVLEQLERIYHQAESEDFFVAPIGTKPQGIAAVLFACKHNDIGILYDHPSRRQERTAGVGPCHLFEFSFR